MCVCHWFTRGDDIFYTVDKKLLSAASADIGLTACPCLWLPPVDSCFAPLTTSCFTPSCFTHGRVWGKATQDQTNLSCFNPTPARGKATWGKATRLQENFKIVLFKPNQSEFLHPKNPNCFTELSKELYVLVVQGHAVDVCCQVVFKPAVLSVTEGLLQSLSVCLSVRAPLSTVCQGGGGSTVLALHC